jgi:hypothetical protein
MVATYNLTGTSEQLKNTTNQLSVPLGGGNGFTVTCNAGSRELSTSHKNSKLHSLQWFNTFCGIPVPV